MPAKGEGWLRLTLGGGPCFKRLGMSYEFARPDQNSAEDERLRGLKLKCTLRLSERKMEEGQK